ncbi:hypothetical protein [Burkholderia anthina]|uniref:hypothetical protein n=1 Tax=Burkholderia anthina TaxID=179879 RepID=UPI00158F292B|nr:hypothetical protein [Burkholderia anthina]
MTSLIAAAVDKRPEFHRTPVESITWRMLIEVETEAFTDASFTSGIRRFRRRYLLQGS